MQETIFVDGCELFPTLPSHLMAACVFIKFPLAAGNKFCLPTLTLAQLRTF